MLSLSPPSQLLPDLQTQCPTVCLLGISPGMSHSPPMVSLHGRGTKTPPPKGPPPCCWSLSQESTVGGGGAQDLFLSFIYPLPLLPSPTPTPRPTHFSPALCPMPSPWPTRLESGHCHGLLPPPAAGPVVPRSHKFSVKHSLQVSNAFSSKAAYKQARGPALADSPALVLGVPFCCIGPPSVLPQTPGSFPLGVLLACSSWLLSLPALRGWRPCGACISADTSPPQRGTCHPLPFTGFYLLAGRHYQKLARPLPHPSYDTLPEARVLFSVCCVTSGRSHPLSGPRFSNYK